MLLVRIMPFLIALSPIPVGFGDANDAHSIATNYMISSKQGGTLEIRPPS